MVNVESPKRWRKLLKESMYNYIYHIYLTNSKPTLAAVYQPWENDHKDLLRKYGFFMSQVWARRYMQVLIKNGRTRPDQLELEGMERLRSLEVYRNLKARYGYKGDDGRIHHVETHMGVHDERMARIAYLRKNSDGCLTEIRAMEAWDDYLDPLVRKFGDLPPVDLIMFADPPEMQAKGTA
jgi:hypothetical protein